MHHRRAADWFAEPDDDSRLFFCRFTQLGVLRLLTSEAVMALDVPDPALGIAGVRPLAR